MPLRAKQKRDHVGGPGASLENRKEPQRSKPRGLAPEATKSTHHSGVSGGGGEQDRHHSMIRAVKRAASLWVSSGPTTAQR
jgi:hypothetical protein